MIREAATNTDKRKEKVMSILRQINYNQSETVRNFGLSVDNKFAEVPARILRPPELRYANGNVTPRDGVWRAESKQFLLPQKAANWGFLKIDYRTQRNALQSLGNLVSIDKLDNLLTFIFNNFLYYIVTVDTSGRFC